MWQAETVLLIGGTAEARKLHPVLTHQTHKTLLSQAGVTRSPTDADIVGGFGGFEGLHDFIRTHKVTKVVDASHPFATTISQNAHQATRVAGIDYTRIARPPWQTQQGDHWISVSDTSGVVAALQTLAPVPTLVALGARHISHFQKLKHTLIFRTVDPLPDTPPPDSTNILNVVQKGPFDLDEERHLFGVYNIGAVVCKNSGGAWSYAKIQVARELGLPVIMLQRPAIPDAESMTMDQLLTLLTGGVGRDDDFHHTMHYRGNPAPLARAQP